MSEHKFPYRWNLSDGYPAKGIEAHGKKVFGTFICGGGSTMGYKLAGFTHLGGVEIDPKVAEVYRNNQHPKHLFIQDLREFNKREDLPKELYELDLLDGSPPCSTFSMAGSREDAWGKEKKFREGQSKQTLDDLVFIYCETIEKLRPKVAILENVKGMIIGNAKYYCNAVIEKLNSIGYDVQLFCLNAATMGVPQRRERVFFICKKQNLGLPKLQLNFSESLIFYGQVEDVNSEKKPLSESYEKHWFNTNVGKNPKTKSGNTFGFLFKNAKNKVCSTITSGGTFCHYNKPVEISNKEKILIGSFPLDYNFEKLDPQYLIGMSVPPVMTAQIAHQIYLQWLSKLD